MRAVERSVVVRALHVTETWEGTVFLKFMISVPEFPVWANSERGDVSSSEIRYLR